MTNSSSGNTEQEGSGILICPISGDYCRGCSENATTNAIDTLKEWGVSSKRASILARGNFKLALGMIEGEKPYWTVERGELTCDERREFLAKSTAELVIRGLPDFASVPLEIVCRNPSEASVTIGNWSSIEQ